MKKILFGLTIGLSILGATAFTFSAFFPNMLVGEILITTGAISTTFGLISGWIAGGIEQKEIQKEYESKNIEINEYKQENNRQNTNTLSKSTSFSKSKYNDIDTDLEKE